jgi:hypothetical protein
MNEPANDAFARMAGAHIDLANAHAAREPRELAAVALLHAAARYNAFTGAAVVHTAEQLSAIRDELVDDQVAQFREALAHHYDGYIAELAGSKTIG